MPETEFSPRKRGRPKKEPGTFNPSSELTKQMIKYMRRYPHIPQVQVARHFEVSRQRVNQIVTEVFPERKMARCLP
ncbi:MAG: hypothetical protein C5B44_05645 [Acidobacteria bacterium]|nr:MAG: hypothetical protein C5B44_05645 [Acidobacteriota bacterium]